MTAPRESLTQAEVDALDDGAEVVITWTGGNGPHCYTVRVDEYGQRHAYAGGVHVARIDGVGPAPLTRVSLAPREPS